MRRLIRYQRLKETLSKKSIEIVERWDDKNLLNKLQSNAISLPDEAQWNEEILALYVALYHSKYEIVVFQCYGDYAYLINVPSFANPKEKKLPICILKGENEPCHYRAMVALDLHAEVSNQSHEDFLLLT